MQNYCILFRAYIGGFSSNLMISVRISNPHLLLSKRYSMLEVAIEQLENIMWPWRKSIENGNFNLEYILLRSNCGLD